MVGHFLLSLYHIEKIINDKKPLSNGDVICPTVLKNREISGDSVDTAAVF